MSFSECLVFDRYRRAFENAQEPVLVAKQRLSNYRAWRIRCARLKIRSKRCGAKSWACFTLGSKACSPSGAIEPPDHPLGDLNGVALLVVGGNQLMDETFGMYPAQ